MNKPRNQRVRGIRYLMALPLVALMLMGSNKVWAHDGARVASRETAVQTLADVDVLRAEPTDSLQTDSTVQARQIIREQDLPDGATPPSFPGGLRKLSMFIAKNLKYPQEAIDMNVAGRVVVTFVVETDGKLTNVQVLKGVTPVLDKEAVRVIKAMPKWIPAEYQGQKIATLVTQPVQFKTLGGDF